MNIYAGNLSHSVTDEQLKTLFETFGAIKSAKVIRDRFTGDHRGFGFVEFENREEGAKAIAELNGTDFEGRTLRLDEAKPRESRPAGGNRRPFGDRSGGSRGPRRF